LAVTIVRVLESIARDEQSSQPLIDTLNGFAVASTSLELFALLKVFLDRRFLVQKVRHDQSDENDDVNDQNGLKDDRNQVKIINFLFLMMESATCLITKTRLNAARR
jgi:hypothetical protein